MLWINRRKFKMLFAYQLIVIIFWTVSIVFSDDEHICDDKDGLVVPHPGECQLFYDCRFANSDDRQQNAHHLFECPYPYLFSEITRKCEWFEFVNCGMRQEPISGCDYRLNQHPARRPCSLDFPHCDGLPDGPNVIESKIFTSSYAVCYKGRFLFEGKCPNTAGGNMQIFEPNTLKCTPMPW